MPRLVRLYIRHVLIGFAISAVFVAILLWQNVGNLAHLVFSSDIGWMAVAMLFFANGIVFAGVQFAVVIMSMGEREDGGSGGGRRDALWLLPRRPGPVPVRIRAGLDGEGASADALSGARPKAGRRDRHDRRGY